MNGVNRNPHLFRWRLRLDAMAEVEDIPPGFAGFCQHAFNSFFQSFLRQKEGERIDVALHGVLAGAGDGIADG